MSWKSAPARWVIAFTLTTSRSRWPRLYPVNSPNGPSGVRAHEDVRGLALHELERLAEEAAHDRALVLVDRADGERAERDGRMHADGEADGQRFAARLRETLVLPEMLPH